MEDSIRSEMEAGFGVDFSGVRIHDNSNAEQMSQQFNAQAFTNGNDIYFNSGKYDTSSSSGKHLLAHELTHTIQQGASVQRKESGIIQRTAQNNCTRATTGVSNPDERFTVALNEARSRINWVSSWLDDALANPGTLRANNLIRHMNVVFNCPDQSQLQTIQHTLHRIVTALQSLGVYCDDLVNNRDQSNYRARRERRLNRGNLRPRVGVSPHTSRVRQDGGYDIEFFNDFFRRPVTSRTYMVIQAAAEVAGITSSLPTVYDYSVSTEAYMNDMESYALLAYIVWDEAPPIYGFPDTPPCERTQPDQQQGSAPEASGSGAGAPVGQALTSCAEDAVRTGRQILLDLHGEGQQLYEILQRGNSTSFFICDRGTRTDISDTDHELTPTQPFDFSDL